jgi:hypothetical protein
MQNVNSSMRLLLLSVLFVITLFSQSVAQSIPAGGLRLHLKADEGVSVVGAENSVTGWTNQSGVSLADAVAPSEATRPTLVQNVINGKPAVRFTGGQYLNLPAASNLGIANSDYEIFIVYRSIAVLNQISDVQFLLSGIVPQYELHTNSGAGAGFRFIPNNIGEFNTGPNGQWIDVGTTGQFTNTEPQTIRVQATDTYGSITMNGSITTTHTKNSRSAYEGPIRMGIRADGSFPLDGDIAEIIIYNQILSEQDRLTVEAYLLTKYYAPTIQSSNISFSEVSDISIRLQLTPGSGTQRLILAKSGSAVDFEPVSGTTYTSNATFGTTTELGSGNYVIYAGSGDNVVVTGLSPNQNYHFAIFEYNETAGLEAYFTSNPARADVTTFPIPKANLAGFYSADFGTILGETPNYDFGKLRQWLDQSGTNNHAQPLVVPDFLPTVVENAINGKQAIRFAQGGTQFFYLPNINNLGIENNHEIFIVARSAQAHTNPEILLGHSLSSNSYDFGLNMAANSGASYVYNSLGGVTSVGLPGQFSDANPNIFHLERTSTLVRVGVNNSTFAERIDNFREYYFSDSPLTLGRRAGGTNYFYGDIAEVIVYNQSLSEADRTLIHNYLSEKYNIPLVSPAPAIPASEIQFTEVTETSMRLNLNRGDGSHRVIFAKAGAPVNFTPVDGTVFTANSIFGNGTALGDGNFAVYVGDGNEVDITNLNPNTTYHFYIAEFNITNIGTFYLSSSPTRASQVTIHRPTLQSSNIIFPEVTEKSIRIQFTPGNGQKRIVIARSNTEVEFSPVDGNTYTANSVFGESVDLGGNSFLVYKGNGTEVTITGLLPNSAYYFAIYEYNEQESVERYLAANPARNNAVTFRIPTTNLRGFFSADVGTTVSAGKLVSWQDQSVNQNHALSHYQPANRPSVVPNAFNGQTALRFAQGGTEQFFLPQTNSTLAIYNSDYEIFVVARSLISHNDHQYIMSVHWDEYNTELRLNYDNAGASFSPKDNAIKLNSGALGAFTNTNPHIFNYTTSNLSASLRVNDYFSAQSNGFLHVTNYADYLRLGVGGYSSRNYFYGDIAEVIIYNAVLSETDRDIVHQYLSQKYSISLGVPVPTVAATNLLFDNVTGTSLRLNLTPGNGSGRMVVAKATTEVDFVPVDGSSYSATAAFGAGEVQGNSNYIVYAGAGSEVTISGLNRGTTYHFAVFEFNGNPGEEKYLSSNATLTSTTTLPFSGGTGTEADPFQITSVQDFNDVRSYLSSHFILSNDINLDVAPYNTGEGWNPIGTVATPFTGLLNGNGKAVQNLLIQRNTNNQGLFGSLSGTVTNLVLSDITITLGETYVNNIGSLAGQSLNATVSDVTVNGIISENNAGSSVIGGLVGTARASNFENLQVAVNITIGNGYSYSIGGAFGEVYNNTTVTNMQVTGNVISDAGSGSAQIVGGLAGYVSGEGVLINNSSATGNVTGSSELGGLLAELLGSATVRNSSASGNITSVVNGLRVGGFAGAIGSQGATIENSYATGNVHVNEGGNSIGGFGGIMGYSGTLSNLAAITGSFSTGSVTSNGANVGGFIGTILDFSTITNSFTTGSVSGNENVGGFFGSFDGTGSIEKTFALGKVTGTTTLGGFGASSNGTTPNSYWNPVISGQATSAGGTSLTLAEMTQAISYSGWNFENTWQITEGTTLPWLRNTPGDHRIITPTLTGGEGWRVMASPLQGTTIGSMLEPLWTQGFTGADVSHGTPNVYTWATNDATQSLTNWTAVQNATDALAPGQGVLVYVFRDDQGPGQTPGTFPKVLPMDGIVPGANFSLTERLNPNVGGWTLLGNPYASAITWNALTETRSGLSNAVYVYDPSLADWRTWNGTIGNLNSGEIGAFNAFFVETLVENPALDIPQAARNQNAGNFMGRQAEPVAFALNLETENSLPGTAWFHFTAEGDTDLDASDAKKLHSLVPDRMYLASQAESGELLTINHLPLDVDMLEIPLHFESAANGFHEIHFEASTLPADWSVLLTDKVTGSRTTLTRDNAVYRFEHQTRAKPRPASDSTDVQIPALSAVTQDADARFVLTIAQGETTGIIPADLPSEIILSQNYPNPFNPTTTIAYALPETAPVRLDVFDMLGRRVATLVNTEAHAPGSHAVSFDASRLTSGVYVYRLQAGSTTITRKFTLIK